MIVARNSAGERVVESVRRARGLGEVRADDGAVLPFHCTAIADGSRTVAVGLPVRFTVVAGRLGRWEATQLVPL